MIGRIVALWRPLLVALVIAGAGVGFLVAAGDSSATSPAANRAVLDADATAKVAGDVSAAIARIFSYTPDGLAETEHAAASALAGRAATQYKEILAPVKQQAPAQRLALTTEVVRAGVVSLEDDRAELLVFLDQKTTRAGRAVGTTAAAQLTVTARRDDGRWRITDIRSS
ncbi:hypothetical protein BTM25_18070 [Actinomadura rubteroloni]|uniref:Mce-associated membrane protein n=1 Tax=Actinomadura rubteroloni TaxID=1926885 RepID=A0A2P4UQS8_9ACTN|nr:hypothetical protein [Actinomadura rubteroloni]POM27393.1 hypothetical protein BTM25_18070 [Actinomadura rubteroloni]